MVGKGEKKRYLSGRNGRVGVGERRENRRVRGTDRGRRVHAVIAHPHNSHAQKLGVQTGVWRSLLIITILHFF